MLTTIENRQVLDWVLSLKQSHFKINRTVTMICFASEKLNEHFLLELLSWKEEINSSKTLIFATAWRCKRKASLKISLNYSHWKWGIVWPKKSLCLSSLWNFKGGRIRLKYSAMSNTDWNNKPKSPTNPTLFENRQKFWRHNLMIRLKVECNNFDSNSVDFLCSVDELNSLLICLIFQCIFASTLRSLWIASATFPRINKIQTNP